MIKAIDTLYKGYRFRSRTEARWAVFFDAMGIEYEYEKEGFELSNGRYLPDFYLPNFMGGSFAEIKGQDFTSEEKLKCYQLCQASSKNVLMLNGQPDFKNYLFYETIYTNYCPICDIGNSDFENGNSTKLETIGSLVDDIRKKYGMIIPLQIKKLTENWNYLSYKLRENNNPAAQSFTIARLHIKSEDCFEVRVNNSLDKKFIEQERELINKLLQKSFNNTLLIWVVIVDDFTIEKRIEKRIENKDTCRTCKSQAFFSGDVFKCHSVTVKKVILSEGIICNNSSYGERMFANSCILDGEENFNEEWHCKEFARSVYSSRAARFEFKN